MAGRLVEAQRAIAAVFEHSRETRYNWFLLLKYAALFGAQGLLPRRLINLLKTLKKDYGQSFDVFI